MFSRVSVAPEIRVGNPVVHTRPGMQAKIECLVFSHPAATVHWFINGMPVNKRNNVITTQDMDLVSFDKEKELFIFNIFHLFQTVHQRAVPLLLQETSHFDDSKCPRN